MSETGGQDDFQIADETLVDRGFKIQDPATAIARFSEQELPRLRDTLPDYDDGIFQEAITLTLNRLRETIPPQNQIVGGDEA
ncbi:MAG: hypothetical protein G8345_01370 [Magnetococcales bacterium]|nr:hypothetical protein [Magnetococcales bacterium]NGZ25520.1 hypothetical protein [Magnetococcales bacterium]